MWLLYRYLLKIKKKIATSENISSHCIVKLFFEQKRIKKGGRGGGLRVKIGCHIIGAWLEMGQNRIRGGWGVKNGRKSSDIIYVRSLTTPVEQDTYCENASLCKTAAERSSREDYCQISQNFLLWCGPLTKGYLSRFSIGKDFLREIPLKNLTNLLEIDPTLCQ